MAEAPPTTVFLVDDDVSVRESLEMLLRLAGWRVQAFASAEDFLSRAQPKAPSCLVLDVSLPELGGLDLQARLQAGEGVAPPVVFVTGQGDIPTSVRAMKAGAADFLTKPVDPDALLHAVEDAIGRSCSALAEHQSSSALHDDYGSLSRREREVMALVASGLLNKQVGGELGISEITVKAHRGQVMRKMKAHSFAELVVMAGKLGIGSARAP